MNSVQIWLQQKVERFEGSCRLAAAQLPRLKTMQEVVRAADVSAPAEIRMIVRTQGGYRRLKAAANARLEALLAAQLKEVQAIEGADARKEAIGRLRDKQWRYLRGEYASLYRRADIEGRRLLVE